MAIVDVPREGEGRPDMTIKGKERRRIAGGRGFIRSFIPFECEKQMKDDS